MLVCNLSLSLSLYTSLSLSLSLRARAFLSFPIFSVKVSQQSNGQQGLFWPLQNKKTIFFSSILWIDDIEMLNYTPYTIDRRYPRNLQLRVPNMALRVGQCCRIFPFL